MKLTLHRMAFTRDMGVFGSIRVGERTFFTCERPWLDNKPYESCVPGGLYSAVKYHTTLPVPESYGGKTWYLIGGSVGLNIGHRTRIGIHIGNTMNDLEGCIALGTRLACVSGKWAIGNSTKALEEFAELVPDDKFDLLITGVPPM